MSKNHSPEEIDLGDLFRAIKRFIKRVLILIYRFIQFLLKSWIILLVLLIIGIVGGYFWQKYYKSNKVTELIVRTNFESSGYIYSAIDQLNKSASEKKELSELNKIEIEPIIDIEELFEDFNNEMAVIDLVELFQDKEGPYTPNVFISRYKYHKIEAVFNKDANSKSIEALLNYLQKNPLFQSIKEVGLQNLQARLEDNERMAEQVDEILTAITSSGETASSALMVLGSGNEIPLDRVLEFKKEVLEENDEIRENILAQQELIVLLNKPQLVEPEGFFAKKIIFFPVLLIFIYLTAGFLIFVYRKMERLARNQ